MFKTGIRCGYNAAYNTVMHDGIELSGYLAFLSLLSLFPFLVFIVAIAGMFGQDESGARFITSLLLNLPEHITYALQPRIEEIISGPPQGLLTVSIIGAVWTASSAVEGLRTVLNRAYHVHTPPAYIFRRLLSIVQMMLFAFILVVVMLAHVFIPLVLQYISNIIGMDVANSYQTAWDKTSRYLIPLILFIVTSFLYYLLPNIKQRFISVAPGAFVVSFGLMGTTYLLTLYLSKFNQVNLIYGSLGGVIAALLFAYISNLMFIFGAELNYQIVKVMGMRVVEKERVEAITAESPKER
jgi:membrane protein